MCEPTTILLIATAATGAVSSVMAGNAQAASSQAQAQISRNNAIISGQRATQEEQIGKQEEERLRRQVARVTGTQRAMTGAAGIELGSGSPLDVLAATVEEGELDALTIRSNAQQRASDLRFEQQNLGFQAGVLDREARSAQRAGWMNAAGSILGAASSMPSGSFSAKGARTAFANAPGRSQTGLSVKPPAAKPRSLKYGGR